MARVFFGRVLAIVVFVFAILIVGAWVTRDRPTEWLARLAGDETCDASAAGAAAASSGSPAPSVTPASQALTAASSARAARLARRPAAR